MAKIRSQDSDGSRQVHLIFCPACGCAHSIFTGDGGWSFNGDTEKPTIRPSILVNGRTGLVNPTQPRCHSFVTDGKIQYLADCTHGMAGQTVDLLDF